jgi:5'-phosphate synthase pdxT subunit
VLALQGDVREHLRALAAAGATPVTVRRPTELAEVDGLVLPGGESTTMIKLARAFELLDPLRAAVKDGLPVYGSCAGMILLADRVDDGGSPLDETIGGIDMTVRRNAFGRQIDSFEADVDIAGLAGSALGVVRPGAGSASSSEKAAAGRIVAVRQQHLLATSFHPELTGDGRIHAYFVEMVRSAA